MPNFYVYSAADVGLPDTFANWFASPSSTVSASISADLLQMSDDDAFLENEGGGSDQLLTADLFIDGVLVGSAGDVIINLGQSAITNATTGDTGFLVVIQVNGVAVGYGSTIELNAGDSISMGAWFGSNDQINYDQLEPVCFTKGTLIATATGDVAVENMQLGDRVWTKDAGFQPVRWIGRQVFDGTGRFAPILFRAGALDNKADLLVSPMHRMLITGWRAEILFGQPEILAHASDLINDHTILRAPCPQVEYFHLMFDGHQILCSQGCLSESFDPFAANLHGYDAKALTELLTIFPELSEKQTIWPSARPTLNPAESKLLQSL